MNKKQFVIIFFSFLLLSSCQLTKQNQAVVQFDKSTLYFDEAYPKPSQLTIEPEQDIFKLDQHMQQLVDDHLRTSHSVQHKISTLLEQIFSEKNIAISYSSNANFTAQQAFHSKKANCMSLTILAYALATQAGLDVEFQQVNIPEYWVRNGDYNMLTGHINLLVSTQEYGTNKVIWGGKNIEIDFDPFVIKKSFSKRKIKKNTVIAMFYNNKGAEALVNKDYNTAYYYFKAATVQDESFSAAWGNLGVIYRMSDQLNHAEKVYNFTLSLDKNNLTTMTNLAVLYRLEGKIVEAEIIEQKLHYMRIDNPYYHSLLADEAIFEHRYSEAVVHFKKAINLNSNVHEFYFGLSKVYYQLNNLVLAKRAMAKAIKLNKLPAIESQYIAKLNFLKQIEQHN